MQGFNYDKEKELLHLSDEYHVKAMIAAGRPGRKEDLPLALQEREVPSNRKKVEEVALEGRFRL